MNTSLKQPEGSPGPFLIPPISPKFKQEFEIIANNVKKLKQRNAQNRAVFK